MIYLLFTVSLVTNGILVWYIKKLLKRYWFDSEAREKFSEMIEDYQDSLKTMYKLEELYGEEIIKKAIVQTQFVIEACKEFQESVRIEAKEPAYQEEQEEISSIQDRSQEGVIVLREGEKVSQKAANYKKIVLEN